MKRPIVILMALVVGLFAVWLHVRLQPPSGIEVMGDEGDTIAQWLTLAIAVVSLVTAIVGLVQKIIELRAEKAS